MVGVLLIIKEKKATLIFYKNGTCLEECYEFSLERLKDKVHKNAAYLCPFISVKGEIQVTLDSKAVAPLDSYRFKWRAIKERMNFSEFMFDAFTIINDIQMYYLFSIFGFKFFWMKSLLYPMAILLLWCLSDWCILE